MLHKVWAKPQELCGESMGQAAGNYGCVNSIVLNKNSVIMYPATIMYTNCLLFQVDNFELYVKFCSVVAISII